MMGKLVCLGMKLVQNSSAADPDLKENIDKYKQI